MNELPEEIKDGLFRAIVRFRFKYPDVSYDDTVILIMDIIAQYDDYLRMEVAKQEMK